MVAERLTISESPQAHRRTLMYKFEFESEVDEFVRSLTALAISPQAITVLQLALQSTSRYSRIRMRDPQQSPQFARYTWAGALGGGVLGLLLGLVLQYNDWLALTLLESIFIHFIALIALCAVLGGTIGAILVAYQVQEQVVNIPPQNADGYLVVVKTPPAVCERCELLAQSLGARHISV